MPSEHRTHDRTGRPVTLRGVVTHVAGRRVAFEFHHPERGLWHLWVADHTCFPCEDAEPAEPVGAAAEVRAREALRGLDPRGSGCDDLVGVALGS